MFRFCIDFQNEMVYAGSLSNMKKVIFPSGKLPKLDTKGKLILPKYRSYLEVLRMGYTINAQEYLYLFWLYTDKTECLKQEILDLFFRGYCNSTTTAWRIRKRLLEQGVQL